jgi:cullin 3
MNSQRKRIPKIEPFKHRVEVDPKFFDKSWKKLDDAIREIYNHNASGLSFEELYRFTPLRPSRPVLIVIS